MKLNHGLYDWWKPKDFSQILCFLWKGHTKDSEVKQLIKPWPDRTGRNALFETGQCVKINIICRPIRPTDVMSSDTIGRFFLVGHHFPYDVFIFIVVVNSNKTFKFHDAAECRGSWSWVYLFWVKGHLLIWGPLTHDFGSCLGHLQATVL